jgi:hypothetical protein
VTWWLIRRNRNFSRHETVQLVPRNNKRLSCGKDCSGKYWDNKGKGKGKAIPLQAWTCPEGSRRLRFPDFKTIGKWRWQGCQSYAPAAFTLQESFLVIIYVRDWVNPRTIMRPEGSCQWKIPVTPSAIETMTFWSHATVPCAPNEWPRV